MISETYENFWKIRHYTKRFLLLELKVKIKILQKNFAKKSTSNEYFNNVYRFQLF